MVESRSSGLRNRLEAGKEAAGAPVVVGEKRVEKCEGALGRERPGSAARAPPQRLAGTAGGLERPFPCCSLDQRPHPPSQAQMCEDQMRQ